MASEKLQLILADISLSSLTVNSSTGSINSSFDLNLTNITAGATYVAGLSAVIDQFLADAGGASNFSFNIAANLGQVIEGTAPPNTPTSGSYSGSAGTAYVPAPATAFLFGTGLLGLIGFTSAKNCSMTADEPAA